MVAINLTEGHKKSIYGSLGINFVEQSQREIRRSISHLYSYKVHCSTLYSKTPIYRGVWGQGNIRG